MRDSVIYFILNILGDMRCYSLWQVSFRWSELVWVVLRGQSESRPEEIDDDKLKKRAWKDHERNEQ